MLWTIIHLGNCFMNYKDWNKYLELNLVITWDFSCPKCENIP